MEICQSEALRYLGYRANRQPDAQTLALLQETQVQLEAVLAPKSIYKEATLRRLSEGKTEIGGIVFQSRKLQTHLRDADRILLFAATLGAGADRLIRRFAAAGETAKAAAAQALGAAAIEGYCDELCAQIAEREEKNGYYLRPRFSPGYSDLPLEAQRDFFKLLDVTKRIGVTLTDQCMMLPTKSVTAFIGLAETPSCATSGCETCPDSACAYRKGET